MRLTHHAEDGHAGDARLEIELDRLVYARLVDPAVVGERRHGDDEDSAGALVQGAWHSDSPPLCEACGVDAVSYSQPSPAGLEALSRHGTAIRSTHPITAKKIMPIAEIMMIDANWRAMSKFDPATTMM